jgi:membrane protease YdiL (CAAX protease family)
MVEAMQGSQTIQLLAFLPLGVALVLRLSPGTRPWQDWRYWAALSLFMAFLLGLAGPFGIAMLLVPALMFALRGRARSKGPRWCLNVLVVLWCLVLAHHRLPGIHNPLVWSGALSPSSAEYRLFWNLDKAFAALYLFELVQRRPAPAPDRRLLGLGALALAAAMVVACSSGLTGPDPKWSSAFLWWAPANLLLVVLPEETLFRFLVQDRLEARLQSRSWGPAAALVLASLLFGLAHIQGSWRYVIAASAAGLGYGCAYRYARNPWHPVLVHFGFNTLHFLAFVYPWTAAAR